MAHGRPPVNAACIIGVTSIAIFCCIVIRRWKERNWQGKGVSKSGSSTQQQDFDGGPLVGFKNHSDGSISVN